MKQNLASAGPRLVEARVDELRPYECAVVRRMDGAGDDVERLKSMGLCLGRRVELVRAGDPLILRVLGVRLGVSARLAAGIVVERCDHQHCGDQG